MQRGARRRGGTVAAATSMPDTSSDGQAESMAKARILDLEAGQCEVDALEPRLRHRTRSCFRRRWCNTFATSAVIIVQTIIIVTLVLVRSAHPAEDRRSKSIDSSAPFVGPRVEFLANQTRPELEHLIMVPGHGVTITESLDGADSKDVDWFLLDYQKDKDVPQALVTHMKGGLDELDSDKAALLLFSGGKTRVAAGPKSEGESYYFVADHYDWWGKPFLRARAATEDFARDSFENLMFSICRFKEITGNYPTKITVVGYDFKQERFETLHRAAIRFPTESFKYRGLHAEGKFDYAAAEAGERETALEPYQLDPYGCAPDGPLEAKRIARNPFHRNTPYALVCPEMLELLEWCGPGNFQGDLPWSH